jgi:preprotein translocase subunit SecB
MIDVASVAPVAVELIALNLHGVTFRMQGRGAGVRDVRLNLSLNTGRPSSSDLLVRLTFSIEDADVFKAEAGYGLRFRLKEDAQLEDVATYWRTVAAQLAPVITYPYVRELINSLGLQSGMGRALLPVMNIGAVISPDSVEIPPVAEKATASADT